MLDRFLLKVNKNGPICMHLGTRCWQWIGPPRNRYGAFSIKGKPHKANRISYKLFVGHIPSNMLVLHKCDNTMCVNPDHLFLGTHQDNQHDKVIKGRQAKGSNHGRAVLTENDVREIRRKIAAGGTKLRLAKKYGVTRRTIKLASEHGTWTHVI